MKTSLPLTGPKWDLDRAVKSVPSPVLRMFVAHMVHHIADDEREELWNILPTLRSANDDVEQQRAEWLCAAAIALRPSYPLRGAMEEELHGNPERFIARDPVDAVHYAAEVLRVDFPHAMSVLRACM